MKCDECLKLVDSHISGELPPELEQQVAAHLENCLDCRRELDERLEARNRLRAAFRASPGLQADEQFVARLRAQLQACAGRQSPSSTIPLRGVRWGWAALAACFAVFAVAGAWALWRHAQSPSKSLIMVRRAPDSTNQAFAATLLQHAVGGHDNCAVRQLLKETVVSLEEAARRHDPAYANLDQAALANKDVIDGDLTLKDAHSCALNNLRFGHVILKHSGRIVSLVVCHASSPDESLTAGDDHSSEIVVAQLNGYQVANFVTKRYAAYVVSDLSERENLEVARALAPAVRAHLTQAENISADAKGTHQVFSTQPKMKGELFAVNGK